MRRRSVWMIASGLATSALLLPREALANEHEWYGGASFGYASIDFTHGLARHGIGGGLHSRYGLTDAIDLTFNAWLFGFADDGRIAPGTSAGISYVLDISRWIPSVGGTFGVVDVIGLSCELDPARCRHDLRLALGIPITFEFRALPELPLGVRFEYQFLFLGEPSGQLFVGATGAFMK